MEWKRARLFFIIVASTLFALSLLELVMNLPVKHGFWLLALPITYPLLRKYCYVDQPLITLVKYTIVFLGALLLDHLMYPFSGELVSSVFFLVVLWFGSEYIAFRDLETGEITKHPAFRIALVVKLVAAAIFASDYMLEGVLPFVRELAINGVNPYDAFLGTQTLTQAFPLSLQSI